MAYSHGKEWSDSVIEKELLDIINSNNMTTFPSHLEMNNFTGGTALSNAVSRSGGTKFWANRLNYPIKSSESKFGDYYELMAKEEIEKMFHFTALQTMPRYPYDLIINDNIKIDVKASRPHAQRNKGYEKIHYSYTFNLEKENPTCDIFICYCLDMQSRILKTLIIPSCITAGLITLNVVENSRWDIYKDNWDCIKEYDEFYKKQKDKYV